MINLTSEMNIFLSIYYGIRAKIQILFIFLQPTFFLDVFKKIAATYFKRSSPTSLMNISSKNRYIYI
ncbi:unnamed protein product [Brassica oleracea]